MTSFERCRNNLKQTVAHDQKSILLFIQYEVAQEKSVVDAFESFCKILGDDAMKYTDFDYWYYRFKDGKFDLDHDRSTDPSIPGLSDMPVEVAESILKYLEWSDRCVVRKVSRNFQVLVDASKQYFGTIVFCTFFDRAVLEVQKRDSDCFHTLAYTKKYNGGLVMEVYTNQELLRKKELTSGNVLDTSANDLCLILKCPRVEIKEFEYGFNSSSEEDVIEQFIQTRLQYLDHQVHIKRLHLRTSSRNEVLAILPYLKPGVLEVIEIKCYNCPTRINIDDITELDQWKLAKTRTVQRISCNHVDQLFNLTEFNAELTSISTNDFIRLKNALRASPDFRLGRIETTKIDTERIRIESGMESLTIEDNLHIVFYAEIIRFRRIH